MDELAERSSNEPRLGDVADDGRRQTDEHNEQVCRREVDDEQVGDGAHLGVLPDDDADERVACQPTDEDSRVQNDDDPLERRREDVVA